MDIKKNVSVILTVFNGARYIDRCIQSILSQTVTNWELIIVDDGSKDFTVLHAKQYLKDERITLHSLGRVGRGKALNEGIRQSCAEFIAIQDVDDVSLPDRLERQANYLNRHPQVVAVGSAFISSKESPNKQHIRVNPVEDKDIRRAMSKYNPLCHTSVMYRRSSVVQVGLYDEGRKFALDAELWIRLGQKGKFANIKKPLVIKHPYSWSYFNSRFSKWERSIGGTALHYNAIKRLKLSKYLYLLLPLRFITYWLPKSVRRHIRTYVSNAQVISRNAFPAQTEKNWPYR